MMAALAELVEVERKLAAEVERLAGAAEERRMRGRPPKPEGAKTGAERQKAYRERRGESLTVVLPPDVKAGLARYMLRESMDGRGRTTSEVIADLLRLQLLRKR